MAIIHRIGTPENDSEARAIKRLSKALPDDCFVFHNFEVATAKDGIDALERMDERVPDLMLLDIEMPRMDGYELATAMKADPRLRNVPIIMITSRTGEKHRQRAFDIGVERYLGKPYQEHELLRNVFELLAVEPANG